MTLRVSFFLGSLAVASLAMAQASFMTNDSVAVFYPPHYDAKQHQPSPIFEREPIAVNQLTTDWPLRVSFSQKGGRSIATIDIKDDVDFYRIVEHRYASVWSRWWLTSLSESSMGDGIKKGWHCLWYYCRQYMAPEDNYRRSLGNY